jgi:hypothetical protein
MNKSIEKTKYALQSNLNVEARAKLLQVVTFSALNLFV